MISTDKQRKTSGQSVKISNHSCCGKMKATLKQLEYKQTQRECAESKILRNTGKKTAIRIKNYTCNGNKSTSNVSTKENIKDYMLKRRKKIQFCTFCILEWNLATRYWYKNITNTDTLAAELNLRKNIFNFKI